MKYQRQVMSLAATLILVWLIALSPNTLLHAQGLGTQPDISIDDAAHSALS